MSEIQIHSADKQLSVSLFPLGASIAAIHFLGKDLCLGFHSPIAQASPPSHPYVGTIGRVANRIQNASFVLHSKTYPLHVNNGPNCLHGGNDGFDKRMWTLSCSSPSSAVFSLHSPDGDQGFPGALDVSVSYEIVEHCLRIGYKATATTETMVNLTTHTYFNLSGFANKSILSHIAHFPSALGHLPLSATQVPTSFVPVPNTESPEMDFTTAEKPFSRDFDKVQRFRGYDHFYVLLERPATRPTQVAARIRSPDTRIEMEVRTSAPGFQLYTGNWLQGDIPLKASQQKPGENGFYETYSAFCVEASGYPDAIHSDDEKVRRSVLVGGEYGEWNQRTEYSFAQVDG